MFEAICLVASSLQLDSETIIAFTEEARSKYLDSPQVNQSDRLIGLHLMLCYVA